MHQTRQLPYRLDFSSRSFSLQDEERKE